MASDPKKMVKEKMTQQTKFDPIRIKYFVPIEHAEKWSGYIFAMSAILSIAAALINEKLHPTLFASVQVSFLVIVIALFLLDQWIKLYLAPRGADARILDFLSRAYDKPLSSERTELYYNSTGTNPGQRIGAQTFENSLFTKEITREMCKRAAPLGALYLLFWIAAIAYRDTPLPLLATCAQVVFGEQIIARLLRLFWLQRRSEDIYDALNAAYISGSNAETFDALVMNCHIKYESAKALAGVTLSSNIFEQMNAALSAKWEQLKLVHNI